jgi:GNAT superfamily N-acetyltransferase
VANGSLAERSPDRAIEKAAEKSERAEKEKAGAEKERSERSEKTEKRAEGTNGKPTETKEKEVKPLVIERLTHEDVPDMVQLLRRVWEPYMAGMPPEVQKQWQPTPLEFTSGMEGVTYFCAKRDNRLIGFVGCKLAAGACQLVNVAVDADHRRHGIGTALLAAALGWAQHANARSIYVEVLERFQDAKNMFRATGYKEAGDLHRHFFGEDVRLYEKIL